MKDLAYYNGRVTPIEEMMIPAADRGYYFGDGIYEAALVYSHRIFALGEHLERMKSSAEQIRIELPMTGEQIGDLLSELVMRVESPCQFLYWQITRGTAPRNHPFPADTPANLYVTVKPLAGVEMSDDYHLISVDDTRYLHCNIKTLNLVPNVLASQAAREKGCQEAVFVRDGIVTECSHSNISLIQDGVFITHPADHRILPGIERKHLLEYCRELKIPVQEREFTLDELKRADEVLVSSTGQPNMRVSHVDGEAVGMRAGELVEKLRDRYRRQVARETGQPEKLRQDAPEGEG